MTRTTTKARSRRVSTEEKIEIALAHFETDESGRFPQHATLAERFGRDVGVIGRAIPQAFHEGHVKVVRCATSAAARDDDLEHRLEQRFPALKKAIVAEALPVDGSRDDDRVHVTLGHVMADYLATQGATIFRDGDRIGFGAGRGVVETVSALAQQHEGCLRAKEVTLLSLTGSANVQHHNAAARLTVLDANQAVSQAGGAFSNPATFDLVQSHMAFASKKARESARARTRVLAFDEGKDASRVPTHAILGIGVFEPGHRLYELGERDDEKNWKTISSDEPPEELKSALKELVKISERAYQVAEACKYHPVADVGNYLFLLAPPAEHPWNDNHPGLLCAQKCVEQINERMLTADLAQLASIGSLIVIAGTVQKAHALHTFLTVYTDLQIHFLCTDTATADRILALG